MVRSIHEIVTVGEGGRVELPATPLPPGSRVVVTVTAAGEDAVPPLSQIIREARASGERSFRTVEEIDRHLNELRDEWDR